MELAQEGGGEGILVEALYIIGRYDILEDHLGLPVNAALHQVTVFSHYGVHVLFLIHNSQLKAYLYFLYYFTSSLKEKVEEWSQTGRLCIACVRAWLRNKLIISLLPGG